MPGNGRSYRERVMKAALRTLVKITLIEGGTIVPLLVVVIGTFWFFAPDMCGNEILAEYPSPDEKHRVVVFQRDCGATTGFSTQASILGMEETFENEEGNVFIADTDRGAAPSGPGGGPVLFVSWQNANSVLLSFHPKAGVFKKVQEFEGGRVTYSHYKIRSQALSGPVRQEQNNPANPKD